MTGDAPHTSFRTAKPADYADSYMMDAKLTGDRRKRRIDRIQQQIVRAELAKLPAGALVTDVPCGNGRMSRLVGANLKLAAMDFNVSMLQAIGGRKTATAVLGRRAAADILNLPLPDKCVDLFVNMRLLHHLPDQPTRVAMLREIARVTRGRIVTSYWTTRCWRYFRKRLLGKRLRGVAIRPAQMRDAVRQAGLVIESHIPMRRFYEDEVVVIARPT